MSIGTGVKVKPPVTFPSNFTKTHGPTCYLQKQLNRTVSQNPQPRKQEPRCMCASMCAQARQNFPEGQVHFCYHLRGSCVHLFLVCIQFEKADTDRVFYY